MENSEIPTIYNMGKNRLCIYTSVNTGRKGSLFALDMSGTNSDHSNRLGNFSVV